MKKDEYCHYDTKIDGILAVLMLLDAKRQILKLCTLVQVFYYNLNSLDNNQDSVFRNGKRLMFRNTCSPVTKIRMILQIQMEKPKRSHFNLLFLTMTPVSPAQLLTELLFYHEKRHRSPSSNTSNPGILN